MRLQNLTGRGTGAEISKGFKPRGDHFQALTGQFTDDGCSQELLPPAFGLPVIHNQIRIPELAGCAEIQHLATQRAVEHNPGITQRAVSDRHRNPANYIVDDLVAGQNTQQISAGIAVDDEPDDRLGIGQYLDFEYGYGNRMADGANPAFGRTAGKNLLKINRMLGKFRFWPFPLPTLEIGEAGRGHAQQKKEGKNSNRNRQQKRNVGCLFHRGKCGTEGTDIATKLLSHLGEGGCLTVPSRHRKLSGAGKIGE